jgi:Recombinational DNA repair protein (RecF pathway)
MGRVSPIDGVGPNEIGIDSLKRMIDKRRTKEIFFATSRTVEGDGTAFYIGEQFKNQSIKVSRIAYGVQMGGELEYVDNNTFGRFIKGRRELE